MTPDLGLVSLVWVLSCLVLTSKAAIPKTNCCQCKTLMPTDVPAGKGPQIMPSPFKIIVEEDEYTVNDAIHVRLVATEGRKFRSFMLAAYAIPKQLDNAYTFKDLSGPVGKLILEGGQGEEFKVHKECSDGQQGSAYALTSSDSNPKDHLKFVWTSENRHGHVEFRATFVEDSDHYWVAERSRILPQKGSKSRLPKAFYHSIAPISTKECGIAKGCFREPAGCVEPQCTYLVTWSGSYDDISIEMGGLSDGASDRYMAVGFSDDTYMGNDVVFTCAHNSATGGTEVYVGTNEEDPKRHEPLPKYKVDVSKYKNAISEYKFITQEEGSYANNRLRCRFTIKRELDKYEPNRLRSLRGKPQHLLLAHGYAKHGAPGRHGLDVLELPMASEDAVDLNEYGDHSARASYPLAKAHGCLMILAWVLFASIGLLLTKYYKTMWPNKRMYDNRYWFLGHVQCMAMVFIITIIGFILIFVEAGGYSQAPDLPQKAHPILGIIIFCCIIINPILALLRPSEDSKCRPVFNWFHWAFGTIANVLAIPQIFIGMDFGKVMVPWWATWILVIWVIFHIVVELSLEIHQCCTYKKNKERRKKWEQLKREYPKQHYPEPEPAGRRFKRFMLFLHVSFTILITLIMIIIIAVS